MIIDLTNPIWRMEIQVSQKKMSVYQMVFTLLFSQTPIFLGHLYSTFNFRQREEEMSSLTAVWPWANNTIQSACNPSMLLGSGESIVVESKFSFLTQFPSGVCQNSNPPSTKTKIRFKGEVGDVQDHNFFIILSNFLWRNFFFWSKIKKGVKILHSKTSLDFNYVKPCLDLIQL